MMKTANGRQRYGTPWGASPCLNTESSRSASIFRIRPCKSLLTGMSNFRRNTKNHIIMKKQLTNLLALLTLCMCTVTFTACSFGEGLLAGLASGSNRGFYGGGAMPTATPPTYQFPTYYAGSGVGTSVPVSGGSTSSGSSTGSSSGSSKSCSLCHGLKKCWTCNGKRQYINPLTGKYVTCPNCTNGLCSSCGGTGKQ